MHPYVMNEIAKTRHADLLRDAEKARLARSARVAGPSRVEKLRALFSHAGIPRLAPKAKPRVQPA